MLLVMARPTRTYLRGGHAGAVRLGRALPRLAAARRAPSRRTVGLEAQRVRDLAGAAIEAMQPAAAVRVDRCRVRLKPARDLALPLLGPQRSRPRDDVMTRGDDAVEIAHLSVEQAFAMGDRRLGRARRVRG